MESPELMLFGLEVVDGPFSSSGSNSSSNSESRRRTFGGLLRLDCRTVSTVSFDDGEEEAEAEGNDTIGAVNHLSRTIDRDNAFMDDEDDDCNFVSCMGGMTVNASGGGGGGGDGGVSEHSFSAAAAESADSHSSVAAAATASSNGSLADGDADDAAGSGSGERQASSSRSEPGSPKIERRRRNHHKSSANTVDSYSGAVEVRELLPWDEATKCGSAEFPGGGGGADRLSRISSVSLTSTNNNNNNNHSSSSGSTLQMCTVDPHLATTTTTSSSYKSSHSGGSSGGINGGGPSVSGEGQLDSDSDYGPPPQHPPPSSNNRSKQKKFLKTFGQMPQEEVLLQRYSCALVGDILLQGHLYITENYFAFYSNVFGYVTKLQIPIRSVVKISKEKTAKFIPNAVGMATADEKHVFGSLLSRDSTFKFLTHLWKRAMRDSSSLLVISPTAIGNIDSPVTGDDDDGSALLLRPSGASDPTIADPSSESDCCPAEDDIVVCSSRDPLLDVAAATGTPFLVKRVSAVQSAAAIVGNSHRIRQLRNHSAAAEEDSEDSGFNFNLAFISRSMLMSVLVIALLFFLLCSSVYLVYRVNELQTQVESRYTRGNVDQASFSDVSSIFDTDSSDRMKTVLSNNVDQIATVRQNLERLSSILRKNDRGGGGAAAAAAAAEQRRSDDT